MGDHSQIGFTGWHRCCIAPVLTALIICGAGCETSNPGTQREADSPHLSESDRERADSGSSRDELPDSDELDTSDEHDGFEETGFTVASFEPVDPADVTFVEIECAIEERELDPSERFIDGLSTLEEISYRIDSEFTDPGYERLESVTFEHPPELGRADSVWFDDDGAFVGACPDLVAAFRSKAVGVEDTTSGADLWEFRFSTETAAERLAEHAGELHWMKHPVAASASGLSTIVVEGRHRERGVKDRILDHFEAAEDESSAP